MDVDYVPRFQSRVTIAPKGVMSSTASPPSSTAAFRPSSKDKDYVVFGIYPNNTVVRKNPNTEDVFESPFVIFGIYPNNTIVRKFPNGTVIPEGIGQANEISRDEIAEFEELGLPRSPSPSSPSPAPSSATVFSCFDIYRPRF